MASLKEYLKRYESSTEPEKKKKKKKVKREAQRVLVVDENPVWQKPVKIEDEEEENDSGEEDGKPLVDEDIEVKRMRRLEQIRVRRPYNAIAEDGSGWVSLSPKGFEAGSDMSPPRKRRVRNDTPSPKAEGDGVEEADLPSPRKRRVRNNTPSPKAEGEGVGEADLWPPHKRSVRKDTLSDVGAPLKHNSPLDTPSPEPDLSPPRRRRDRNNSLSPDGRKSGKEIGRSDSPDLSPPRKNRPGLLPPRKKRNESSKEGLKTGLISGRDIREEISKIKKEDTMRFEQMDPSMSGRGVEPIYRDKKGERMSKDEYMKSKQKQEEKPKEKKIEWGKGLAQKREVEARLQELELEKDKPFARTRDDPELDKMLKDRVRWGDPMAHLVKNKHSDLVLPDLGDDEKMKESGFIIPQDIPDHSWIKRGLDAAPNRYGIKPGRHWDGIDRSNGFEKQLFKRMNEKQATEREAYLWSVSDM